MDFRRLDHGPLLVAAGLFSTGFFRLWKRSGTRLWMARSAFAFSGGWLVLVAALVSPIHSMGEHLFTFHMIEHEVLMAVAAPLIVLARQRVYIGDGLNNAPDNLIRWIVSPTHFSRQSAMPETGITEDEARHVAAYLYAH